MKPRLLLVGEFNPELELHTATNSAIEHARRALNVDLSYEWISTSDFTEESLAGYSGVWIAPGSPYNSMVGALEAIRIAREQRLPCLGTCGGFQHMIIEYARNVLSFQDADHGEYNPYASRLFVSRLDCSLVGRTLELGFEQNSLAARLYGATKAQEQYYCNFGVEPSAVPLLKQGPLLVSGSDAEGEIRVIELPQHPFFVGTLFVPQARSTSANPHPIITGFVRAVIGRCEA